jgi:hypothetical protein
MLVHAYNPRVRMMVEKLCVEAQFSARVVRVDRDVWDSLRSHDDYSWVPDARDIVREAHQVSRALGRLRRNQESSRLQAGLGEVFVRYLGMASRSVSDHFDQGERDYAMRWIEACVLLMYQLFRSRNVVDCAAAMMAFVHNFVDNSLVANSADLISLFVSEIEMELQTKPQTDAENAGEWTFSFDSVEAMIGQYDKFKDSILFRKVYKMFAYACSLSIFKSLGCKFDGRLFGVMERNMMKLNVLTGTDFAVCVMNTLLYLCKVGYQCYQKGSFDPLLHSAESYEEWVAAAQQIKAQAPFLSSPQPHGIDRFTFIRTLDNLIDQGMSMIKWMQKDMTVEKRFVTNMLGDLRLIKANLLTRDFASKERTAPFGVLVYGGTSVAKSTFSKLLFNVFGGVVGLPTTDEYMYPRNPVDEYWVNFNSSQWAIRFDEVAYVLPAAAQGTDHSTDELLQVMNSVPFVPVQASLEDKGKTPVLAELVIATTNTKHLNVEKYYCNSAAIMRRWGLIIDLKPKPEFLLPNGMINPDKLPPMDPNDPRFPDYWQIECSKAVPVPRPNREGKDQREMSSFRFEVIATFNKIEEFIPWYRDLITAHRANQAVVMHCDDLMRDIEFCRDSGDRPGCQLPLYMCECIGLHLQTRPQVTAAQQARDAYLMRMRSLDMQALEGSAEEAFGERAPRRGILERFRGWLWRKLAHVYLTMPHVRHFVHWFVNDEALIECAATVASDRQMWRTVMSRAGQTMWESVKRPQWILALIGGITVILGAYKLGARLFRGNTLDLQLQGNPMSLTRKSFDNDPVWYKSDYATTPYDLGPSSVSGKGESVEQFQTRMQRNFILLRMPCGENEKGQKLSVWNRAFCVADRLYAMNTHALAHLDPTLQGPWTIDIIRHIDDGGVTANVPGCKLYKSRVRHVADSDLTFIWLDVLPSAKNALGYLPKKSLRGVHAGYYLGRKQDGSMMAPVVIHKIHFIDAFIHELGKTVAHWTGFVDRNMKNGECGSLCVTRTSSYGHIILGIHFLGEEVISKQVGIQPIWAEDAEAVIKEFVEAPIDAGHLEISRPSRENKLGDLHAKSPFRYVPNGSAEVYGSLLGHRSHPKSRVTTSPLCDWLSNRGFELKHGKPIMSGWEPKHNALKDMLNPTMDIDPAVLDMIVASMLKHVEENLSDEAKESLGVVDIDVAINGVPGIAHLERINISSSAGFPYKTPKKKFLEPLDAEKGLDGPLTVTAEIMAEIRKCLTSYKSGTRWNPVFTGNLKDEARKFEKIQNKMTRLFMGAPMEWIIVFRMYFLTMLRIFYTHHELFEAAPGIAANSGEWSQMALKLKKFKNCLDGDFANYDKQALKAVIMHYVFRFLIGIAKMSGKYSEEDITVFEGISVDCAFAVVDFFGDVVMILGMNPSGNPATVIFNCVANSILMRYAYWYLNPEHEVDSFRLFVVLFTYGDDNIMSVSDKVPWFNQSGITRAMASIGITFTAADKLDNPPEFKPLEDCQFLKRRFVWDDDMQAYLAPLENSSLEKALMLCVESKSVPIEEQCISTIGSVVREYFHHGKQRFKEMRGLLQQAVKDCGLSDWVAPSTFPTWEQEFASFTDSTVRRTFR